MKTYLLNNWAMFATVLLCVVGLALGGCTFLRNQPATASLAIQVAVGKYIEAAERPAERAQRVRDVAGKVLVYAQGAPDSTVDALKAVALASLPANMTPADRLLASAVVEVAVEALKAKVKEGKLPDDLFVNVRTVVQAVIDGTVPYLPKS